MGIFCSLIFRLYNKDGERNVENLCNIICRICCIDRSICKSRVKNIDSNLATGIRTVVILFLILGVVMFTGSISEIKNISPKNLLFLIISGLMTVLSWLFYFKAIQIGDLSKVAPIDKLSIVLTIILGFVIFREPVGLPVILGAGLIVSGIFVLLKFT